MLDCSVRFDEDGFSVELLWPESTHDMYGDPGVCESAAVSENKYAVFQGRILDAEGNAVKTSDGRPGRDVETLIL